MTGTGFRPAIVFVLCVASVYLLAAGALLQLARRRSFKSLSGFQRLVLMLAAIGVLCIAYGYFIEPNWLAVSHVELRTAKIPPGGRSIRIAHFSDLHSESRRRLEPQLVEAVAAEHPDIIVFTGDSMNSLDGLPVLQECLAAMAKIAPTFVVRGNWDTDTWPDIPMFDHTGVRELNGEAVREVVGGIPIWIAGLAFDYDTPLARTVAQIPRSEFSVFLYHSPDLMPYVATHHIDLFCAGHTHGGQVALPFYGALITLSNYGKRYEAGLYHEMDTWLYVNRGIGMAGGRAPRVRFWSRPELTIIDIKPAE